MDIGKSDEFCTELVIFVRDLLLSLSKQPRAIGRGNVRLTRNGDIVIIETEIRKLKYGYWPPEVFRGEVQDEKSLVYTLGAFLIHIITDRSPFHRYEYPQLLYNVGSGNLLLEPPENCHPLISSIIIDCCRYNPEKRSTFQALYVRYFTAHN